MGLRPRNATSGSISCDARIPEGRCKEEFEGADEESYPSVAKRALEAGWGMHLNYHYCPKHAWIVR